MDRLPLEQLAGEVLRELLGAVRGTLFCRSTAERERRAAAAARAGPPHARPALRGGARRPGPPRTALNYLSLIHLSAWFHHV